ncbi:hypothetical protein [Nocardiopsis sp. MG754419]|nr:hypothetical protein [Nocardiopsis sp. MG754419]
MIHLILGLLYEVLLGPVQCANCGATVDSRAPGCWSCGQTFG